MHYWFVPCISLICLHTHSVMANDITDSIDVSNNLYSYPVLYPEHHLNVTYLESLRSQYDEIADNALDVLQSLAQDEDTSLSTAIDNFLNGNILLHDFRLQELHDQIHRVPEWVDWNLVRRGQLVFIAHAPSALLSLLHSSLIGGFSAPKIVKVLDCTGYLMTNEYSTMKRLKETLEMVVDVLEKDALYPGCSAWKSVLKVRLLHSRVRKHILKTEFDVKYYGIPLNEGDMIVTQLAFSSSVLLGIDKIGIYQSIRILVNN